MVLPTRDDFLANALEPVEHEEHEDCSICKEPMTSPVRTPCKHEFCKHCITKWLTQTQVDSCPTCRRCLFQTVHVRLDLTLARAHLQTFLAEVLLRQRDWVARRENAAFWHERRVNRVFEVAGFDYIRYTRLMHDQTDFRSADVLNLNRNIRWSEERLDQLRRDAETMLINDDLPRLPQGAVRIDAESLGTSLILMSNALMHLATAQSRPWSDTNRDTWRQIVMTIWHLAAPGNGLLGILLNRESLYLAIMTALIEQQCVNGDEQDHDPPMFFRQADLVRDLRFMVNFVVDHAGPTMSSDTVQEELTARRIEEPRVYLSTASARVNQLAAAYTSMTFVHEHDVRTRLVSCPNPQC